MNDKNTLDVYGRCYCGAVRFLIAAETEHFWAEYRNFDMRVKRGI